MRFTTVRTAIEKLVEDAMQAATETGEFSVETLPPVDLERPRDEKNGDFATSLAMRCAKQARQAPRAIAEAVASHMAESKLVDKVDVAGPGFINIYLSDAALQGVFAAVRQEGNDYGRPKLVKGEKVDLEFISANPTGPMHLGHGRWAALGDAMANVLAFAGYDVTREFYINDAGRQMDVFASSVATRYLQIDRLVGAGLEPQAAAEAILSDMDSYSSELGEESYAGAYVVDIALKIYEIEGPVWANAEEGERKARFKELAYATVLDHTKELLLGFGLDFDVWYSERTTYAKDADGSSRLSRAIDELREKGYLYEKDGATWFRTTEFGDDKDRVLIKADGSPTYFAPDIAYHKNKFDRGFERCIDLLGADHHGYIKRIQSVGHVFGHPGQPEIVIGQMVNLFRDGKPVRMSKRTGEMVTFEELIDEVGVDATRFLMLSRSTDQAIDFDIAQAKRQDATNPVYYVQYAHARICSLLLRAAAECGIDTVGTDDANDFDELSLLLAPLDTDLSVLVSPYELSLARKIDEFGYIAAGCARDLAPFRLTHYLQDMAQSFHQFYTQCHCLTDDENLTHARLAVADAARRVIESALSLLGVSAPTHM